MAALAIYADSTDLATWTGDTAPANADTLLRSASLLVDRALSCAVYDVDADGLPTNADVIDALRDATCAQAATWAALGIDPTAGPAGAAASTRVVSESRIGTGIVKYGVSSTVGDKMAEAVVVLCSEAVTILHLAGFRLVSPWIA